MTETSIFLPAEMLRQVKGSLWKEVIFFQSIDSTNDFAARLAAAGEPESGTVIVADSQERGRGRHGRTWVSPPGLNICMSIVLKPEIGRRQATLLTVLTAVACSSALRKESRLPVSIKWPNDLVVSGKKIGGILTELKSDADRIRLAVIGIGINVNGEEADFPSDLAKTATSLRLETGREFRRGEVVVSILREFESRYKRLPGGGRASLIAECRRLSSTIGKRVMITTERGTLTGRAEDIDDEGLLLLRLPSGLMKRVSSGEVTMLRF